MVNVHVDDTVSHLFLEAGTVVGWDSPEFNLQQDLLHCGFLPKNTVLMLESITPDEENAGLSLIFSNLLEPERWNGFVQRVLEQEIYPILISQIGSFNAVTDMEETPQIRFHVSVQQLVLGGSRWEADSLELHHEGYGTSSAWVRQNVQNQDESVELSGIEWLTWSCLNQDHMPVIRIAEMLCMPELDVSRAVKRLHTVDMIKPADKRR